MNVADGAEGKHGGDASILQSYSRLTAFAAVDYTGRVPGALTLTAEVKVETV